MSEISIVKRVNLSVEEKKRRKRINDVIYYNANRQSILDKNNVKILCNECTEYYQKDVYYRVNNVNYHRKDCLKHKLAELSIKLNKLSKNDSELVG
jgi:hypothetical protein